MVTDREILITVACLVVSIVAYVLICGLETWLNNRAIDKELRRESDDNQDQGD